MSKKNLLTYLDEQLTKKITAYDTAIDWDKQNHSIEVLVRLFAENKLNEKTIDVTGVESEESILELEDGVLFFNPQKSKFDEEYYLTTIPYEEKKGLTKGKLDAFIDCLQTVLDDGMSDLLDYANDEEVDEFSLKWKNELFEEKVTLFEEKSSGKEYLAYPRY